MNIKVFPGAVRNVALLEALGRTEEPAADVRGLCERCGELTATDGLDLRIRPGEATAARVPADAGMATAVGIPRGRSGRTGGVVQLPGADPATTGGAPGSASSGRMNRLRRVDGRARTHRARPGGPGGHGGLRQAVSGQSAPDRGHQIADRHSLLLAGLHVLELYVAFGEVPLTGDDGVAGA